MNIFDTNHDLACVFVTAVGIDDTREDVATIIKRQWVTMTESQNESQLYNIGWLKRKKYFPQFFYVFIKAPDIKIKDRKNKNKNIQCSTESTTRDNV